MNVLPVCMSMRHMLLPGACRGQKIVLDPRELEMQTVVSHHIGTGNGSSALLQEQPVLLASISPAPGLGLVFFFNVWFDSARRWFY